MLGRKDYTKEEIDRAKAAVSQQLTDYKALVKAMGRSASEKKVGAALDRLETDVFNNMVLVLDRFFVHRVRMVAGKDGNPLNEVELLSESLMSNNGILDGNNVIKYVSDGSVLKLQIGDPIRLTAEQFGQLSEAFFAEIERRFL